MRNGTVYLFLFTLIFIPSLTGCSLFRVKQDSEYINNSSILLGRVSCLGSENTPVVVAAYSKCGEKRKIVHCTCLREPGSLKGSPQDWRYFFDHIDRTRYQPWFFYYPSGASLKTMGNLLSKKIWDLQLKYRFERLYITASSMGGLIARSFLVEQGKYHPYEEMPPPLKGHY